METNSILLREKNIEKIIEIFNITKEEINSDGTLVRVLEDNHFNVEFDLEYILKYILKAYGCKNKKLQDALQSKYMQKYGWGKLSGNYTPAYGNISL